MWALNAVYDQIGSGSMTTRIRNAARRAAIGLLMPAVLLTTGCDLDAILEVDIPGKVDANSLSDPALATVLVNSVIGDAECGWSNFAAAASHHSDEWIPTSGNLNMREWGQRKMSLQSSSGSQLAQGSCASNYGIYTPLQTARFQNEDVFSKLAEFDAGDVPDKARMQGTVRLYGGWSLLALGEGFCSMALDGGPEMQPDQVFEQAVQKFTEAISGVGDPTMVAASYAGRARAKLDMGDWSGAISDAQQVPEGFKFAADRAADNDRRMNQLHRRLNDTNDGVSKHGSVANHFRDLTVSDAGDLTQNDGMPDPRVPVRTIGNQAFDFSTIHYFTDKYTSRADPAPMASWEAAQLIIAEASAQMGDVGMAVGVINTLRAKSGLPEWAGGASASQADVIAAVLAERSRELFVEQAWRFNDMLQYRGSAQQIPFLGEPGSIHPNGLDQTGAEYGTVTCWELPLVETNGNENIG